MKQLQIKPLALQEYESCLQQMQQYTLGRNEKSLDQVWLVEHPPVYTLGLNSKPEHLLNTAAIPVIQSDRGGQVTYHGPGQLIIYNLLDLKRLNLMVKQYVQLLEQSVIDLLNTEYNLVGHRVDGAPGVYINNKKISALGIRVKRSCCYHGLALNVNMDITPYDGINPCGYAGLEITQLSDFGIDDSLTAVANKLLPIMLKNLGIDNFQKQDLTMTDAA